MSSLRPGGWALSNALSGPWYRFLLTILVWCQLSACGNGDAVPNKSGKPDVLLVTIDTARFDRFSYSGRSPVQTPYFDSLVEEGVGFTSAVTSVPVTLPAHCSILTGRNPNNHLVRTNGLFRLSEEEVTLAERLKAAGYSTAAFLGASVLDSQFGLDQGFDFYDDEMVSPGGGRGTFIVERRGSQVVDAAERWLHGRKGPVMLWVHLFDPHYPYKAPSRPEYRGLSKYDREIAYTDEVLGTLIDLFRGEGRWENTAVIATADHGESLGEHGESSHGIFVFDSTVRVPMAFRLPGSRARGVLDDLVHVTDIYPTVISYLGLEPSTQVDGLDLMPLIQGRQKKLHREFVYSESMFSKLHFGCSGLRALRSREWKYLEQTTPQLFSMKGDAEERVNRIKNKSAMAERMRNELERSYPERVSDVNNKIELEAGMARKMMALGYVVTESKNDAGARPPDPAKCVEISDKLERAEILLMQKKAVEALASVDQLLVGKPRSREGHRLRADILAALGRFEDALVSLDKAIEMFESDAELWGNKGVALQMLGRSEDALHAYSRAVSLNPAHRNNRVNRWRMMLSMGNDVAVRGEVQTALDENARDEAALMVAKEMGAKSPR